MVVPYLGQSYTVDVMASLFGFWLAIGRYGYFCLVNLVWCRPTAMLAGSEIISYQNTGIENPRYFPTDRKKPS